MSRLTLCESKKVAGGEVPPDQDIQMLAELIRCGEKDCCLFSAK